MSGLLYRTTYRHSEHPPQVYMLVKARANILAESHAQTNRHTEVQERMLVEARARMVKEAYAWNLLLIARACT